MDQIVVPLNTLVNDGIIHESVTSPQMIQQPMGDIEDALEITQPVQPDSILVSYIDVEPIEINEIVDTHGRLSDILETFESELHVSVIPLQMADIAPEVSKLSRHEIFTFAGVRYAFSQTIRKDVCDGYIEQIVKNISEGIPYELDLVTSIASNGKVYQTLLLSREEWTYIMSRCRTFKQSLVTDNATQITLRVFAERA